MNWLHYLLEANLYLAVFFAGYYLFLRRETYYTLNRIYLLFSCIVSFALPVIQLGILKPVEQPITGVKLMFVHQTTKLAAAHNAPVAPVFTWENAIVYTYLLGVTMLLIVLLIKLYRLLKLTSSKTLSNDESFKVIYINESDAAFSFFNYLFIGTKVQQADMIIKHELVHIRQKHSADIIFMELLKIVNWFNPFIYLLQYSLREIHEYIADQETTTSGADTLAYSSFLVDNAYGLGGSSLTHSFFNYNLLKKRIIMLHQKRSGSLARLRYLLAIPICGGLLCASTLAFSKTYGWVDIAPHRINPANKSPQVAEPAMRLLLTKSGVSTITDKFTAKSGNGTTKTYTVHNLSNKDIVDLKKQGIIVNIISNVKIDSGKSPIAQPSPLAQQIKKVKLSAPNPPAPVTSKGYQYAEEGYVINGKPDITVSIIEKNGDRKVVKKSKATPAELALLKDKYGYVFPAHLRIPPPPPAPPVQKLATVRLLPPPPAPPKPSVDKRPPPPPPFETVYKDFFGHIERVILYPKKARTENIMGTAIAQYTLDANHHVTNVQIIKSDADIFNIEIIKSMTSYTGSIDKQPGNYSIAFRFCLDGETNKKEVKDGDAKLMQTPNYTGELTIVGYKE